MIYLILYEGNQQFYCFIMAYVKQICEGYNKKSMMGIWYEERLYLDQPFREQQLKQSRQKDAGIVCFDQTGLQRDLPRIQRRSKWVTRGRIVLDDGFNTFDTTMKASYPHSELKTAANLTLQPFNKNLSAVSSTDLHPYSQIRTNTKQHKMFNQSVITELNRNREIRVRSGFANKLPTYSKQQKTTNYQSHYKEQFKRPSQKHDKKQIIRQQKIESYHQNPQEDLKRMVTMEEQYKRQNEGVKPTTKIQLSKDTSILPVIEKKKTEVRKGMEQKNDIQTSLNMNIGVHNIHPKNVTDNFFGHKKSSITGNPNKNLNKQ